MTAEMIKEYALQIGYTKVGIAPVERLAPYAEELLSRGDVYKWLESSPLGIVQGATPTQQMPSARAVIVLAWDYYQSDFPQSLRQMLGRIYLARCYNPPAGTLGYARKQLMKQFLEATGIEANIKITVPARFAAQQAGVASIGRNNFAYVEGVGSYVVLDTILVDVELEYDEPLLENNCPPGCSACMKACPTQAIEAPFRLNPKRCIGYNNWMTQSEKGFIPHEIRDATGCRVHGCDVCQDVCPQNVAKRKAEKPMDRYLEKIAPDITAPAMAAMDEAYYQSRVRPIMYNYIKNPRYFRRNAIIAMGNTKDEAHLPQLEALLGDEDAMLRGYAAWALGKIGGERAQSLLLGAKEAEADEGAAAEIALALQQCGAAVTA